MMHCHCPFCLFTSDALSPNALIGLKITPSSDVEQFIISPYAEKLESVSFIFYSIKFFQIVATCYIRFFFLFKSHVYVYFCFGCCNNLFSLNFHVFQGIKENTLRYDACSVLKGCRGEEEKKNLVNNTQYFVLYGDAQKLHQSY